MRKYAEKELMESLHEVSSSIRNCEKIQPKFAEGTSSHSLLKNRLKALYLSKVLILEEMKQVNEIESSVAYVKAQWNVMDDNQKTMDQYIDDELTTALSPVTSIISKCEKAQLKSIEGTSHHTRFQRLINAMSVAKSLILDEIARRGA